MRIWPCQGCVIGAISQFWRHVLGTEARRERTMFKPLVVYADFNNSDALGRLRLNIAGAVEDIRRQGLTLRNGLRLVLSDGDLEADATVVFSTTEGIWVGVIDWDQIRHV